MKQKYNKKYLKTNFVSFIIVLIIFGSIGVYAAITFSSDDVSYDNSISGLKSTSVKGAIDELYAECTNVPAGEQIIEDAGLTKDEYEDRYFFTGANPNNYITFNNEEAGWRILSVEGDGTIKIIRILNMEHQIWDTSESNNWVRPATLNTYLNSTYYNNQLNIVAKNQIVSKNWSIGAVTDDNNDLADQVNDENGVIWKGKIALITVSEYLRTNSDKSKCSTFYLNNTNNDDCAVTNWLYLSDAPGYWTVSVPNNQTRRAFIIIHDPSVGYIGRHDSKLETSGIHPVLYLSSNVKITGGTGTQADPYTIE